MTDKRYTLKDKTQGEERHFADRHEDRAKKNVEFLESEGHEVELIDNRESDTPAPSGAAAAHETPDVVEATESDAPVDPDVLAQDPIEWLESQNTDFVNTIKGTPAISKQGFRFIQQRFGIRTESDVVETFSDPRGVIVWARAERPDGQYAEAHGEGYISESDVDDNEFVRYADTRAKNRAISDLTSAGALAVSELGEQ